MNDEPLNENKILSQINAKHIKAISQFEIFDCIDSTNAYLLNQAPLKHLSSVICLAEQQTAGYGRFGRIWHSPKNGNIYLSILRRLSKKIIHVSSLSLAVGVAVVRALCEYGIPKTLIGLKWPNDILIGNKKLAGILLETCDKQNVVIGIGLNVYDAPKIEQPCIDIKTAIKKTPKRNVLVGLLINEILSVISMFEKKGFKPFLPEWKEFDALLNKRVEFKNAGVTLSGIVLGVSELGELIVKSKEGKSYYLVSNIYLKFLP